MGDTRSAGRSEARRLSLKWKVSVLTSLVFVALGVSFSLLTYTNLQAQFDRQRQLARENYRREAEGLLQQSLQRLQQVAAVIPSLGGMGEALRSGNNAALLRAFEGHWGDLQIDWNLDVVQFFDAGGRRVGAWGKSGLREPSGKAVPEWVRDVSRTERPVSMLLGAGEWLQCSAVPLLLDGRNAGVVLVGMSLADLVLELRQVSGADAGLIAVGADDAGHAEGPWRRVSGWNARVLALTDALNRLPVLEEAARRNPDLPRAAWGVRAAFRNRDYEVTLIPLEELSTGGRAFLVIIADITGALAEIDWATRGSLYASIAGLVVFEGVLLGLLWTPLRRVARIARNLPLLGQGAYKEVRAAIGEEEGRHWGRDEVDVLDQTALDLSRRLEGLDREITRKNLTLTGQRDALQRERDFIRSLLDTAQVAILTTNGFGEVVTVNDFTEALTGRSKDELAGVGLPEVAASSELGGELVEQLGELWTGRRDQLRHEARLVRSDGALRHVVWLHSRLRGRAGDGPVVLSVGLDVTDQKQAESRLAWLGDHDPLTGLFNRRRFEAELSHALAVFQRYGRPGAILLLDLDQFKYVNDTSGHRAGDLLLTAVSEGLSRMVRAADVVARLGGDEFVILLRETDEGGAIEAARKVQTHLGEIAVLDGDHRHKVSASVGIARFPDHGADVHGLLASAEIAMYSAKESGRGGWHVFSETDAARARMQYHLHWKGRIEEALATDGFVLVYQPILDLQANRVTHYEALLRMRDGDGGLVSPDSFIRPAEQAGLIHAIDHLVMDRGIAQAGAFARAGHDVRVSVNLSAHAFEDPELLPQLRRALRDHDVEPDRLIFEITETAVVGDLPAARDLMRSIRDLGCRFALDDFGVGFSSFYYLKHFPVDFVKIDGSFIRQLREDPNDQILVRAMAQVARGFGKKTIAEYVESAELLNVVRTFGIDYAQGYHIGRPVPAEEILSGLGTDLFRPSGEPYDILVV
ncbi:MAG: EAL domain-containing protein [Deltaproteobacteria bacterium]|nr:EAL domain-containing protein [Deltaproteobacteria bacterium]